VSVDDCIKYSGMTKDIELLQKGIKTIIGENGVNLSGG